MLAERESAQFSASKRNFAICSRRTVAWGQNRPAAQPLVIPSAAIRLLYGSEKWPLSSVNGPGPSIGASS